MLAALGEPVVLVDTTLFIRFANGAAQALLDAPAGSLEGASLAAVLAGACPAEEITALSQAVTRVATGLVATDALVLRRAEPLGATAWRVALHRVGDVAALEFSPLHAEHELEALRRELAGRGVRYHAAMVSLVRHPAVRDGRLAEVAVQVTRCLSTTLNVARVSLWWLASDGAGEPLELTSVNVYERRDDRHSVSAPLAAADYPRYFTALSSGDAIVAEFAQSDARTREFTEGYLVPIGITSLLDVPILSGGRVVGVLCHEHIGPHRAWTLEEQQFANFAANIICLARETAEHLEAERAAEESRLFLDSIVENLPLMVFVKDAAELGFVRFNRAGEELLGLSREELLGRNDLDFFDLEQASAFVQADRVALAAQEPIDIPEEPILSRSRGHRVLHTRKIAIRDAEGTPRYLLGISEDITERRRH